MQNSLEIQQISKEEEVEIKEIAPKVKSNFSWLFIQLVVCIIVVGTVIILKQSFPNVYSDLQSNYSKIIEKTMLIEDGEIRIVQE